MKKATVIVFMLLYSVMAFASPIATQDHAQIKKTVLFFIQQQTASLPGKVNFKVGEVDQRITMPACNKLEVFLPVGSPLIGKTSIGVRCTEKNIWSIFVPAQIKISLDLLISNKQLPLGHLLQTQDFTSQTIETTQLIGYTDPAQVIGKVLRYSIAAGQVLREDMLRPTFSVTQGQIVQLITQGEGFNMRSEGSALRNASEGQSVQVRTNSGRVVAGVAHANGIVAVNP